MSAQAQIMLSYHIAAAGGSSDLLLETGSYLLLEDGFKLILE